MDPSPLKEGQKVSVLWKKKKTKKEFSAVLECYPVQPASREPSSQESLSVETEANLVYVNEKSHLL